MEEERHGQIMKTRLNRHLVATQELHDNIAQLGKRNKPQGRRPPHGERRFGDALDAGYVEPKPPDPSWITKHQTSYTHEYSNCSYHDYNSADDVNIYSFSGSSWSSEYLTWERTMDDWFTYYGVPKKERLAHAIKQLSGKAYSWWKRVYKTHGKSPEEVVTNWKDLKDVMIRKYVTTLPTQETRRKYPRRFSNGVSKEAKKVVPQQGHRSLIYQDQIRPSQMPMVLYDKYQPYEVLKSMEKKNLDVKTGHEVQKDMITQSLLRSKVVRDLSSRDKEILNPNKEEPSSQGLKEQEFKEEEPPGVTLVLDQKIVQETMQSTLLKEPKPKQYQER
ncbi:uncharacterized protein LOC125583059 [Brassica napus]|uniref:uncharacterized protein LOC125583059 n=1 Tax=Brassica napus TaxID=3708 RepID=UPI00207A006B|nr:uncharacterized protein LOC125583059 [Brassica napus]